MSTLPASAEEFLRFLKSRDKRDSTIKRYKYDLADFNRFVEVTDHEHETNELTLKNIEEYFHFLQTERRYKLRTLKRIQTVLAQYGAYLKSTGRLSSNPMEGFHIEEAVQNELEKEDLISPSEEKQLLDSISSDAGLSVKQQASRPLLAPRNIVLLRLFIKYGLRLQEVAYLRMKDVNLSQKVILVPKDSGNGRKVLLSRKDQALIFQYLRAVPDAVRPKRDNDPLFVAFDFQRQTYRWSYENDSPKMLTEVAIQKMIRQELERAGVRKGLSAQHFRNTYIVNELTKGVPPEAVKEKLGLRTILTLTKYIQYVEQSASSKNNSLTSYS